MNVWDEKNKNTRRTMQPHAGNEVLQGAGSVQGRLIGGMYGSIGIYQGDGALA